MRFQSDPEADPTTEKIHYRGPLTGRMKGQAFVTFPDEATSKAAFELANGFVFKGKPLLIQYGNSQASKSTADV